MLQLLRPTILSFRRLPEVNMHTRTEKCILPQSAYTYSTIGDITQSIMPSGRIENYTYTGNGNPDTMAAAQCDVYMLSGNAASLESNLEQGLESGVIKRGQLQRNAANLLNYIMHTHTFARFVENGGKFESSLRYKMDELETVFEYSEPKTAEKIVVRYGGTGRYLLCVDYLANVPELSQLIISVVIDGEINAGMTVNGTDGKKERAYFDFTAQGAEGNIKISFPPLISVEKICIMR